MDAIEMLKTRRSCRSYQTRQLEEQDLQEILACGLNAPSAKNMQDTLILVVQDPGTISMFSRLNAAVWQREETAPFYGAPTLCLILAPRSSSNGIKDGSLVIGAMQNAAFALGVGSCWINRCGEMLETEAGRAWLSERGLDAYIGVGCCILGYPDRPLPEKKIREGRVIRL